MEEIRRSPSKDLSTNNTSGVNGVHKNVEDGIHKRWTAVFVNEHGVTKSKSFSVRKYGHDEAFEMACNYRKEHETKEVKDVGVTFHETPVKQVLLVYSEKGKRKKKSLSYLKIGYDKAYERLLKFKKDNNIKNKIMSQEYIDAFYRVSFNGDSNTKTFSVTSNRTKEEAYKLASEYRANLLKEHLENLKTGGK